MTAEDLRYVNMSGKDKMNDKGKQSIALRYLRTLKRVLRLLGKRRRRTFGRYVRYGGRGRSFRENTWEEAESTMQKEACLLALVKHIWHRRVSVICSVEIC